MSMGKDRVRVVKWSKHRSSPPRHILTTARVGMYNHIITISLPYIYRRTTPNLPPLYLRPYTSYLHHITESPYSQGHRVIGSQGLWSHTSTILGLYGLGSHISYLISLVLYLIPPGYQGYQILIPHTLYLRSHTSGLIPPGSPGSPGSKGLISHTSYLMSRISYLRSLFLYLYHITRVTGYLVSGSHTSYLMSQISMLPRLPGSKGLIPYISYLIPLGSPGLPWSRVSYLIPHTSYPQILRPHISGLGSKVSYLSSHTSYLHCLTISPVSRFGILPLTHFQTSKTLAYPRVLRL